jgi:hypothetical protein
VADDGYRELEAKGLDICRNERRTVKIEDHKIIGSDSQKDARPMSGRKPAYESRATEFRQRLMAWKQAPESLKPSLRALARELDTSHQLLAHYLNGLDRWQAEEEGKRIRARAKAEGRPMTLRECYGATFAPAMLDKIETLRREAKRGPLNRHQVQMLKLLVRQGFPGAKEVLEKCRQMTPQEERQARAAEKATMFAAAAVKNIERIKQEAEQGPLPWWDIEILKILARRKHQGAKELLQKYSKSAEPRPQVPQ